MPFDAARGHLLSIKISEEVVRLDADFNANNNFHEKSSKRASGPEE